ncbi:hypothetical protein QLX08_008464 [Tetragonisca angustula]|uniref:Uncharacterized protein n=1 Tax=Tetragonisca angustula TaxID=166442 RepID=A0AAW0ZJS4_9HYME
MARRCGNHEYEKRIFGRLQLEDIIRNMPPRYVISRYDCPCGHYTTYFTIHHQVMLHMLATKSPLSDELQREARAYRRILSHLEKRYQLNETRQNSDGNNNDDENNNSIIER